MDLVMLPIGTVSIIAICIIIGTLIIAYAKKLLMTYALIFANFIVFFISAIFPEVTYDFQGIKCLIHLKQSILGFCIYFAVIE